jgi:polyisoprenoid-binding protein YceI
MYLRSLFVGLAMFGVMTPVFAAAQTFQLDPNHTSVLWHISHFGFSSPSGKWQAAGTLMLDKTKPENSTVNVTIKVATVDTGVAALDEHLRSKAFFDVDQFPTATFQSDKVKLSGKDGAKVTGVLTLHGVSKPVTLNVKLNKMGINPITEKEAVGFTAETLLKRSEFGMDTLLPGLGDDVRINIEAEAQLAG